MNLNASCISCIVGREEKRIRPLKDEAMKKDYMIRVLHILAEDNGEPAPAKSIHLKKLQEEMLGAQPKMCIRDRLSSPLRSALNWKESPLYRKGSVSGWKESFPSPSLTMSPMR